MTTPHISELPALHTDAAVQERVSMLVGTAVTDRQLWIMFVDGDGVQAPVIMPIAEMPAAPDPEIVDRLAEVLGALHGDLATEQGPGSVVLTWERRDRTGRSRPTWPGAGRCSTPAGRVGVGASARSSARSPGSPRCPDAVVTAIGRAQAAQGAVHRPVQAAGAGRTGAGRLRNGSDQTVASRRTSTLPRVAFE